ncbi:MAG: DUF6797 domain-containing protein [Pirellulales bacterium]
MLRHLTILFVALLFCLSTIAPVQISFGQESTLKSALAAESSAQLIDAIRKEGDAARGAVLYFQPFLSCARCHESNSGASIGPDLTKSEKGTTPAALVESLLTPSKVIRKGFETAIITTADGRVLNGRIAAESGDEFEMLDAAGVQRIKIAKDEIESRKPATTSLMPEDVVNLLSDRQQFLDLAKYVIEVSEGGAQRAKELRPAVTTFTLPEYEKSIDHAGLIRSLDSAAFKRGEAIYTRICANCHGTFDQPGSLPTSPKFATHKFKNGSDPYRLYQTITHGFNLMAPQTWMVPKQKYDVIHYLREAYLRSHNASQYVPADEKYLAGLPKGDTFGPEPASIDPWMAMDYGPSLANTYEVGGKPANIAYKGIAVRLDPGAGGVSRGRDWAIFDHDTLRYAAAWSDPGFIDWKGIHFNGQHQVHPRLVGELHAANPVGPGWADPETGSFEDPRMRGRDNRPYGPLPKKWAKFRGWYAYGDRTLLSYTVGDAPVLELESVESDNAGHITAFTRTLEIGKSSRDMILRAAPETNAVAVIGDPRITTSAEQGFQLIKIPAAVTPTRFKVLLSKSNRDELESFAKKQPAPQPLAPLTQGGPKRWSEQLRTQVRLSQDSGAFAADVFELPERNPWNCLMRLTGFDFYPDNKRMAVCTWDGDVWEVAGIDAPEQGLTWRRIASGLFQPLGLKFRDGEMFVCCRDQIARLHDLNSDGEIDFYECFNNDHQVTEHFHEFAMGLQTDAEGNFYYAKSGRHALQALVPHHGTLLKVSRDGSETEILATGFRAANGVCINPDGTFFITDQEGFWTPKNRINLVERGGFYGNMWGYTDLTDTSDSAMKQPLCWITNEFDRSPAELIWVPKGTWGSLGGSLLNTSYGMGQIFVVPHEKIAGQIQGGMCALPFEKFPTGIMRPRFHPTDGSLYVCGMFAWAGNQSAPGGFYRVRYTGKPAYLPTGLVAERNAMQVTFSDALDPASVKPDGFQIKVWSLKRSKEYGSKHLDERTLNVTAAKLLDDGRTVRVELPDLAPTWCMEIKADLRGADGQTFTRTMDNTIHNLSPSSVVAP